MRYRRISYRYSVHRVGIPQFGDPRSERLPFGLAEPVWRPPADLYDCPGELVLKVEIPGVSEEQLELNLYEDVLVVSGSRPARVPDARARVDSMEIRYGAFRLEVPVPKEIDRDRVSARYESGFLWVRMPRQGGER